MYAITAEGLDEDFPWMSAIVLWERLSPDVPSTEQLEEWMDEGYKLLEKHKSVEVCDRWLRVWEHLKKRVSPDMKSIEDVEPIFEDMYYLDDWCYDLGIELANAGLKDPAYNAKRMEYCREFCGLFPESDAETIEGIRRGEGESLFRMGRIEEGEKVFQDLSQRFPKSAWPYIGWGDMYCDKHNKNAPLDYDKAEAIYREALKNKVDESEEVIKRLKDLEEERGTRGFGGDRIGSGQENSAAKKKQKKSKKK